MKFSGKCALITGSGTGIGKAIATTFVREGASVIILGRRREPLEETAAELRKIAAGDGSGAQVRIFSGVDVSDEAGVDSMFESLAGDGVKVDYIINNAGVSGPVTCFPNASMKDFAGTVAIHLTGTFWVSVAGLRCMERGGKIITISTFFSEERPLEQRPYRFRGPYTASQGAKNRLSEAISWELTEQGIASIATNPGPVHSDRIYKTVYPKAAAEFMRVSGFEGLSPAQVESAAWDLLPLLGEDEDVVKNGVAAAAEKVSGHQDEQMEGTLSRLLQKIQSIAEKVQRNTSMMIADRQFLSQEQVARTVLNLCDDSISEIVNGKVIPGDRVFYPVRPHIGTATPPSRADYKDGCVAIMVDATAASDSERAAHLASHITESGGKVVLFTPKGMPESLAGPIRQFHSHEIEMDDPQQVRRWLRTAHEKLGVIRAVIHLTGNVPKMEALTKLSRKEWDGLVAKFITTPAVVVQESLEYFCTGRRIRPQDCFSGARRKRHDRRTGPAHGQKGLRDGEGSRGGVSGEP